MSSKHTPGPWRWEINPKHKSVCLCGGKNPYDLSVLSFERWGMGGATPRLLDSREIVTRAIDFAIPIKGREHHAEWLQTIDHPDARLIAAAPEMLEMLRELEFVLEDENGDAVLCPVCIERMTHAEDCKLGKLLKEVEG